MLKKTLFAMALISFFIATASAQSYTLTDADSNLTDTQLTADFSGLPADTQLTLESLGNDITEQRVFNTTSGGSATVSWRHNPFEDGTALVSDGWTYRIRDSSGSFNYEFEVTHGNMLTGLDTFNDGLINEDIFTATYENQDASGCAFDYSESNRLLNTRAYSNDLVRCRLTVNLDSNYSFNEVVKFNVSEFSTQKPGEFADPNARISIVNSANNIITSYSFGDTTRTESGIFSFYIDDGTAYIEDDGMVVSSASIGTASSYSIQWSLDGRDDQAESNLEINSYSVVPKISRSAWKQPNRFNPQSSSILFNTFLANQATGTGLEFSSDGTSWSTTLPSGQSSELYYRVTGSEALGSVATDTSRVFQELTFNPIRPDNNTAFVVEENASLNRDFLYEILYERTDCSEFAGLFSAFSLYNQSSGNTITDTVYPNLEMTENQCVFYKEFTEEENLPAGDYRWRVEFQDSNLGINQVWNQYFSIEEAQNVPVSFELRDPAKGETVYLDNGSTEFSYSVDADTQGTLELVIPQYDNSVRYSTTIGSGNQTGSVVLDLDYGTNYDWYLTWTNSTTYQSETNSFNTASQGESPDDGDGDGEEPSDGSFIDIGGLYYSLTGIFGLGETSSNILGAVIIGFLFSAVATIIGSYGGMTGTVFPTVGFLTGLAFSSLIGLIGGWLVFILAVLTATIMAKTGGNVFGK